MNKDPFIELIENFLAAECGAALDSEGLNAINSLSQGQLELFSDQMAAVDQARHHEMVVRDIYSNALEDTPSDEGRQVRPYSAMFNHPYNGLETPSLNELKRQLLFFNRVAIVVPSMPHSSDLTGKRQALGELLRSYLELKPLVDQGSIELQPMYGFYSNEIEGGAGIVRRACDNVPEIVDWLYNVESELKDFAVSARQNDPFFDAGIRIASAVSYGHRLAATHPFVGLLYQKLFSDENSTPNLSEAVTLQNLQRIHLPGLDRLEWEDVVAIRKNEDCIQEWRTNLLAAISSVDPICPQISS